MTRPDPTGDLSVLTADILTGF